MIRNQPTHGYCIFCDDVRPEASGKVSFMGVYADEVVCPAFPARLPKFVFVVSMSEPSDDIRGDITFTIGLPPGEPTGPLTLTVTEDQRREAFERTLSSEDRRLVLRAHLEIAPWVINGPGRIDVVARRNDDDIRIGGMAVRSWGGTGA